MISDSAGTVDDQEEQAALSLLLIRSFMAEAVGKEESPGDSSLGLSYTFELFSLMRGEGWSYMYKVS